MNRRHFLATAAMLTVSQALGKTSSTATQATSKPAIPDNVAWHDVRDWGLEGRAFDDTETYFERLPKRAKNIVRKDIWGLAHNTAGMSALFETDAEAIYIRYAVTSSTLAMPHMPATGMSGVDLYTQYENRWHWLATHMPRSDSTTATLAKDFLAGKRAYQINLPLYNGVKSMEIGVMPDASFKPIAPRKDKPILFYGTSITQGGCASRPGLAFVSILGRRLDRPMLNFGFSGNGRMELEVAQFLAEIDTGVFVVDCGANMTTTMVSERTVPLVKFLREKRKTMPILLLERPEFSAGPLTPAHHETRKENKTTLGKAFDELIAAGVKNLHYRAGDDLLGNDGEGTVDGTHPNDLGMMRYADALAPALTRILNAN